jgi:predicted RNA binding protein YcfA (HicA-like mRNA interferase family)
MLRQVGSHRRHRAANTQQDGTTLNAFTTVPQHPGDIPNGTLRAIERDLQPVWGKGWLRR